MNAIEIATSLIFILGLGFILHLLLRDPILMLKSLFRGLKADGRVRFKMLFFPIWFPVWLIDKIFNLRIFIEDFEDASIPKVIKFLDYEKYIQIDSRDCGYITKAVRFFQNDFVAKNSRYTLSGAEVKLAQYKKFTLLKIEKNIDFKSFNVLIQYIDNLAPQNRVYHTKGVLLHRRNRSDSYFCFVDTAYPFKLIGKTYLNNRMYVDFDAANNADEKIYFNSNIDYFKNFKFDQFESSIIRLKFKNIEIIPNA